MMQAALPKWKSSFILKRIIVQSATIPTQIPHFAYFHSTASSLASFKVKWKKSVSDKRGCEAPAKNYIRFATRDKRSDSKKALKDTLFRNGFSNISSETFSEMNKKGEEKHHSGKKPRSKASAQRVSRSSQAKRQLKQRRGKFFEQFDENPPSQSSTTGFDWREGSNWSRRKLNESDIDSESDSESCIVGKDSDRLVLGLPAKGPLKMDDVKTAFRLAALKWHPDRHQGPTQASAEEKFKRCADAYKSLCDAVPTT